MSHSRGGGVGNMAGSDDRTLTELIAEVRERVVMGGGQDDIYSEELERLIDAIPLWRPIAEAPIPGPDAVAQYWSFPCMIQTERGLIGEGFARWVEDGRMKGARQACVLRWYLGAADRTRDTRVCHDPKYFMPLPAKRED